MSYLMKIIKERRSVRTFLDKEIPENYIKYIIEAGIWAPSACNMQDWRFIVIDDQNVKDEIYDSGGAIIIKSAPLCIAVCYDNRTDNIEYKDHIQSEVLRCRTCS